MNTLQERWESYAKVVLPPNAPDVQRVETRRAFYAGAQSLYFLTTDVLHGQSEEAAVAMVQGWREELDAFVSQVLEGSA